MSEGKEEKNSIEVDVEALRIKYSFYKFLLGTVAISILSISLNWIIQKQKLQFEIQTKENEYIAGFLDVALDEKMEKRRDFAAYFVRLTPSRKAKDRWKEYYEYIQNLIKDKNEKEVKLKEQKRNMEALRKQKAELESEAEKASSEIERLEKQVEKTKPEIEEKLNKQIAHAIESNNSADRLSIGLAELQSKIVKESLDLASLRSEPLPEDLSIEVLQQPTLKSASTFGWVYLGHYEQDKGLWKTRYFDFDENSKPDEFKERELQVREQTGSINVRSSPPNKFARFGSIVSILKSGQKVKVLEIEEWSRTGYIWAKIESTS